MNRWMKVSASAAGPRSSPPGEAVSELGPEAGQAPGEEGHERGDQRQGEARDAAGSESDCHGAGRCENGEVLEGVVVGVERGRGSDRETDRGAPPSLPVLAHERHERRQAGRDHQRVRHVHAGLRPVVEVHGRGREEGRGQERAAATRAQLRGETRHQRDLDQAEDDRRAAQRELAPPQGLRGRADQEEGERRVVVQREPGEEVGAGRGEGVIGAVELVQHEALRQGVPHPRRGGDRQQAEGERPRGPGRAGGVDGFGLFHPAPVLRLRAPSSRVLRRLPGGTSALPLPSAARDPGSIHAGPSLDRGFVPSIPTKK